MRVNRSFDFSGRTWCLVSTAALLWLGVVAGAHAEDGYAQDAASGCVVFKPNLRAGETVAWQGACVKAQATGPGVAKWTASDGTSLVFEGKFVLGKLQGEGRMIASGGDRYVGTYKDGKRDGRGVYVSANQDRFEGQYRENQRDGHGILTLASGQRTEAEWASGVMVAATATGAAVAQAAQAQHESTQQPPRPSQTPVQAKIEGAVLTPKQLAQQQLGAGQQQQLERQKANQAHAARQLALQQQQDVQQAERRRAFEEQQTFNRIFSWFVLSLPLLLAALVWQLKLGRAVAASDRLGAWIDRREGAAREKAGYFANFVEQPFMWCSRKLFELTSSIANQFLRAGIRLALWAYLFGVVLFLAYAVTMFVLGIALVVGLFYLLGAVWRGDKEEAPSSSGSDRARSSHAPKPSYTGADGESRQRTDYFGDEYAETRDVNGQVVAETRNRKDFFGDEYAETRDANGQVVAETRNRKDFFGDEYAETRDANGQVVAETRDRRDFFGEKYAETRDADDKVVRESRERDGLLERYTEHKRV